MSVGKLVVFTGPRGSGKTTLAATCLPPAEVDRVFWHDSEHSAVRVRQQLKKVGLDFGHYVALNDKFSDLPAENDLLHRINKGQLPWVDATQKQTLLEYYKFVLRDLDENLEPGKYSAYVLDTLETMEAGMVAWVEKNKKQAGVHSQAYGGFWTQGVFPLYEQLINGLYARGVEWVILCSHLKTPWEDRRPVVGKVVPAGKKLLYRLSSLMVWLVNDLGNADGAPAGLVLKERLGELKPSEDGSGWLTRRMLPRRIPQCTWGAINRYLENGCDLAEPGSGETMSGDEEDMISELLTDEQMRLMLLGAEQELEELRRETAPVVSVEVAPLELGRAELTEATPNDRQARALELHGTGRDLVDIAGEIGAPLPLIRRWIEEG